MVLPIKSADEVYTAIEDALQDIKEPQTCASLMENPTVRAAVIERFGPDVQEATNKLSDRLSFMWRRKVLDRFTAPPSRSQARWAYAPKGMFSDSGEPIEYKKKLPALPPDTMKITEKDGEVTIELQQFTIIVRPRT